MNDPLNGLKATFTPEQFETLRSDFREATNRFFADLKLNAEYWAAMSASPYRNRLWAAAYLQSSPRTLDQFIAAGELPRKFVGTTPLIPVEALEKLIAQETVKANLKKFAKETANEGMPPHRWNRL